MKTARVFSAAEQHMLMVEVVFWCYFPQFYTFDRCNCCKVFMLKCTLELHSDFLSNVQICGKHLRTKCCIGVFILYKVSILSPAQMNNTERKKNCGTLQQ